MRTCVIAIVWVLGIAPLSLHADEAGGIVRESGVQGGLVVCIGARNVALAAGLRADGRYVVQCLDTDRERINEARRRLLGRGLYGPVSVAAFDGRNLPYISNLVNLIVADGPCEVAMAEMMRVLAPLGVACVNGKKTVKPWPKDIDEWTHFLHGPDNNAVARDTVVGPPRSLQWAAGPAWGRHHDALSSLSAMVSAGGRVFYILDEAPTSLMHIGPQWNLVARDAFSGVLLWRRPIKKWEFHLRYFRTGPPQLPRRLVAVGQRVYVTLGYGQPVTVLDAATGQTRKTLADTENAEEIVCHAGVILVVSSQDASPTPAQSLPLTKKRLAAIDDNTGKLLWEKELSILPQTLAAIEDSVFFCAGAELICSDLKTGKERWRAVASDAARRGLSPWYAPTLVATKEAVLFAMKPTVRAFATKTGKKLWESTAATGFLSPSDLFVANGLAWTMNAKKLPGTPKPSSLFEGRDIGTGEVKRVINASLVWTRGHHHRCYRNKATNRFLITSKRGLEFLDLEGDRHSRNNWVRGMCQYGIMPCNGLTYTPPHPCMCFAAAKLNGFYALAAQRDASRMAEPENRLERGPAYMQARTLLPATSEPVTSDALSKEVFWRVDGITDNLDWPTLRHDPARSGRTPARIPEKLTVVWRSKPGGRLSAPVCARGIVYVVQRDRHTVQANDAKTGRELWTFTAGGPISSPPTIYGQLAVFGCSNGSVYCVRSDNGQLAWRFLAAPRDRRGVSYGQVESVWPVHGSVLVRPAGTDGADAIVYAAAGRSGHLDGGIHVVGIDLATGAEKYRTCAALSHQVGTKQTVPSGAYQMAGILADILVANGSGFCMRQTTFDRECVIVDDKMRQAMFAATGFLDGACDHRSYWVLGGSANRAGLSTNIPRSTRPAPYAKMFVFDKEVGYGFRLGYGVKAKMTPAHHQNFAAYKRDAFPVGGIIFAVANDTSPKTGVPTPVAAKAGTKPALAKDSRRCKWVIDTTMQVRAMLLAGDRLFVAGWHDSLDRSVLQAVRENTQRGALCVLSPDDGRKLAEYELASAPVWDGMIAVAGRLLLTLADGSLVCMQP